MNEGIGAAGGGGRALVLGGGGFLGAVYEIGCLAALERLGGASALTFDMYVGTSGGSVVASLLAAGYSASELQDMVRKITPSDIRRLNLAAMLRASLGLPWRAARRALSGFSEGRAPLSRALALAQEIVPAGVLSIEPLADFLHERVRARGGEDSFPALPRRLYVPAIDLDTGERVVLGEPVHAAVPVSVAVAASCAMPRFFQPVAVGGRDFIDGGIADGLNLDVALGRGAREVLAINPMVAPLNDRASRCLPSQGGACGRVAEQGLVAAMSQAIKISHMISTATSIRLQRIMHPDVAMIVIQPDRLEVDLDNPMDLGGRERLLALGMADGERFASRSRRGPEVRSMTG